MSAQERVCCKCGAIDCGYCLRNTGTDEWQWFCTFHAGYAMGFTEGRQVLISEAARIVNLPPDSTLERNAAGGWKYTSPDGGEFGYYVQLEEALRMAGVMK